MAVPTLPMIRVSPSNLFFAILACLCTRVGITDSGSSVHDVANTLTSSTSAL